MLTAQQLADDRAVPNPNIWLGNGWMMCKGCNTYTFHHAVSHPNTSDCYEVCNTCNCYYGTEPLKNVD